MAVTKEFNSIPILTIDGLSGTGKTSIASQIATELGWNVLYSGTFYRYLALCKLNMKFGLDDDYLIDSELRANLGRLTCRVSQCGDVVVLLGNEDLSQWFSSEEVGREASFLAGIKAIRSQLLSIQRALARKPGLIAEGRDMGRIVFPGANLKVILTADEEVRVQRRFNQLNRCGNTVKIDQVALMQMNRDVRDCKQAYRRIDQSVTELVIDTSNLSVQAVKKVIYRALQEKKVAINI